MSSDAPLAGAQPARALSAGYKQKPGAYDELCSPQEQVRPHWDGFVDHLTLLGPGELGRRWSEAQDLIHENGVSYNMHDDPQGKDRPWPLSPVPVLLPPSDWDTLVLGLGQRARLLALLLEDIYGPQRLITEGLVPPALLFSHPGFLRAAQGLIPSEGRWLPFFAADVVRRPDGQFAVLSDRTQVPTGAGYALENRIIASHTLPDAFRTCNVERLAPFFRTTRDTLARLAPRNRDNPRIVLLSAGTSDPTYFEQAYLAQYLGYPLVHGGDLTVRGGRVFLKTLGGLHPVDVILRRIEDGLCDPLELSPEALIGVPGLVQAVRERAVAVANPLGSGFASTPALLPYLPALCRRLLGEELRLSSVTSWWCGDSDACRQVLERLPHLVIKPAFHVTNIQPIFGKRLNSEALADVRARISSAPQNWVAQEQMTLGTTPTLVDGFLEPRPWVLRTFLVASGDGHAVMPGGLTRFAPTADALEVSIQRGGGSKDTWVMSGGPVTSFSLLPPTAAKVALSRGGGDLPSRVADNLFWLGRYAERCEVLARLGRVTAGRLGDQRNDAAPAADVVALVRALLTATGVADPKVPLPAVAPQVLLQTSMAKALNDAAAPGSLRCTFQGLNQAARQCRDRLSADTWRVLMSVQADLASRAAAAHDRRETDRKTDLLPRLNGLLVVLSALAGIIGDSMTRGQAWRFLEIGRRLERAAGLIVLLQQTLTLRCERESALLEGVLEVADSGMTYRRRYLNRMEAAPVLDLLLTDETNPRSVAFQVAMLAEHIASLPRDAAAGVRTAEQRLCLELQHDLALADVEALSETDADGNRPALAAFLLRMARGLPALSDALSASYLSHAAVSRQLQGRLRGEAP